MIIIITRCGTMISSTENLFCQTQHKDCLHTISIIPPSGLTVQMHAVIPACTLVLVPGANTCTLQAVATNEYFIFE